MNSLPDLRLLVLICTVAVSGCTTTIRGYAGPIRPRAEISTIQPTERLRVKVVAEGNEFWLGSTGGSHGRKEFVDQLELLPGPIQLVAFEKRQQGYRFEHSGLEISCALEAGYAYIVSIKLSGSTPVLDAAIQVTGVDETGKETVPQLFSQEVNVGNIIFNAGTRAPNQIIIQAQE